MFKAFFKKFKKPKVENGVLEQKPDEEEDSPKAVSVAVNPEMNTGAESMNKGFGYTGPMSVADITLESWNNYFAEGGNLNQPTWLQNNRLKEIRKNFEHLARYHGAS